MLMVIVVCCLAIVLIAIPNAQKKAQIALGIAYFNEGESGKAISEFKKLTKNHPENHTIKYYYTEAKKMNLRQLTRETEVALENKNPNKALKLSKEAIKRYGKDKQINYLTSKIKYTEAKAKQQHD